ncbi:MAG TPA: hypothetical protein VM840_03160 [Actinomycetota bacterium]|nr:hypothetical protein [Actinomycetota bacterium]
MTLYAETPSLRARQMALDAAVAAWTYLWVRTGMWLHDLVAALVEPGRMLEEGGSRIAQGLGSAGSSVSGVPVVGRLLSGPLDTAAEAGRALERAGAAQQEAVMTLALVLGVVVAVLPIAFVALRYLPGRARWVREATAARRLLGSAPDLRLFAIRAVANRPLSELRRATPDPAGALESGAYHALAALELRALGIRTRQ